MTERDTSMQRYIAETYVQGWRAGVNGAHLPATVRACGGAFEHGYRAGEAAFAFAKRNAEQHALAVFDSPAMVQAKANAESEHDSFTAEFTRRLRLFVGKRHRGLSFHVAPRYTPGPPAMVEFAKAAFVAEREEATWVALMRGDEGEKRRDFAECNGRDRIVVCSFEGANAWRCFDMITCEEFDAPFITTKHLCRRVAR